MPEALDGWSEFNVAMVGATAALAGLLIVAMSVNISTIMASRSLPARIGASLATLVAAIAVTALGLAPGQPTWLYGIEVVVVAVLAAAFEVHAVRVIVRDHERSATVRERVAKSALGAVPIAAYLAGGLVISAGAVTAGLWFVALGAILAIASAIMLAWVVLVEVLR